MENQVSPIRWDQYSSDESFDDNDYDIESIRIKEAKKQIFLRKFSILPFTVNNIFFIIIIQNEELIEIIIECDYDDETIQKKLENKLKEKQIEKEKKSHFKNFYNDMNYSKKINNYNNLIYLEKELEEETTSDSQNSINEKMNFQKKNFFKYDSYIFKQKNMKNNFKNTKKDFNSKSGEIISKLYP